MKKKIILIAFAMMTVFTAKAQLRTITPRSVFKVPNISHATYKSGEYSNEDNELYWNLHCCPYTFSGADKVVASSSLSSQGSASYHVSNINDGNHEKAWVEGVAGHGIGQWVEFQGISDVHIGTINILNGYVKSDKAWSENARVKRLKVYCNDKPICILELQNSRSLQTFYVADLLENYSYINKLRFEILEVYSGTKYQDTVISEINFTNVV